MLKDRDLEQIKQKGITEQEIKRQIDIFKRGFPHIDLAAPATPGDGILVLDENRIDSYVEYYKKEAKNFSVLKFVPASGAATRMFKSIFEWREKLKNNESPDDLVEEDESAGIFFKRITNFAFWNDLYDVMKKKGYDAVDCIEKKEYLPLIEFLLDDKGLGYGKLPKGLLKFHKYNGNSCTSFEEHLIEGALYGKNVNGDVNLHFTVSPEHMELFEKHFETVARSYEEYYGVKYNIDFSVQDPSTDTIAVDMNNQPFREADGSLLFRPGGHGALIGNLNSIDDDIIFIKNIDNVVPDRLKTPTVKYKKAIGGILLEIQSRVHQYQEIIEKGELNDNLYEQAVDFVCEKLNFDPDLFKGQGEKGKDILQRKLYSPIRVCGMVKNEGEPGGGPFWVYSAGEIKSLQIIESSQINHKDPNQKDIFNKSTHFNPVDIVCGLKTWDGKKYDLEQYIDPNTGFISQKSKEGRSLKAFELPGLWNGAMADWITVFVEVPVITFNPVKTINDLLRDEHQ